ncbi:hypothetical protein AVEN_156540-1 [Araneus ventricosus]|uniref:Uncharacterized protein n=1 Tax=Araneus ventricosus TaxID=182803 RepID=A0A4Y2PC70_ARAVE|nr:hypothetical protein AVEN_156540-1 [Araneus ventricosus]
MVTGTRIFLVAIALFVTTAALNDGNTDKEYKSMLNPVYAGSPTKTGESATVEHIGEAYDYRSNNGIIYPLRYVSAPHWGYQTFQDGIQQFQILSSVFQRGNNSSDSGDGISVEDTEPQNTNATEAVSSSKDTPPTDLDNSSSDGSDNGQYNLYSNNYGTLLPVHYILPPQFGYQTYGQEIPQYQIPSSAFKQEMNSSVPKFNKGISSGGKKQRNTNVSEAISFLEGSEDTDAAEQANVELGNYRHNIGVHSTVHYILNPHVGYQPYGEVLPRIQILPNTMSQHQTSSDPKLHNSTSLGGKKQENNNFSEAISFTEGKTSNSTKETNGAEQANVEHDNYRDNNEAHSTVHYILNPHGEYQPYGEVLPRIQILSNMMSQHQTSSDPKFHNGTSLGGKKQENASSSEDAFESQQLSENSNLIFKSGNSLNMKAQEKNSIKTDFNETKLPEKDVSNTTAAFTVFEDTSSAPSFSLNRKPEHNSQSYADFLTTSLKMYHNEFPLYWIANHPSIGSNDLSSSYFVSNHMTYPVVPLYYHLVL